MKENKSRESKSIIPHSPSIIIKSSSKNTYIILGYDNILYAIENSATKSSIFETIHINNYQFKIKSTNGKFIKINKNDMLIADGNFDNATIFNLFKMGDMEFTLMAPNGYYVMVREIDSALLAIAGFTEPRTRFKFIKIQ